MNQKSSTQTADIKSLCMRDKQTAVGICWYPSVFVPRLGTPTLLASRGGSEVNTVPPHEHRHQRRKHQSDRPPPKVQDHQTLQMRRDGTFFSEARTKPAPPKPEAKPFNIF